MWNKKHMSHRVGHKVKNGKLVAHKIIKNHIERGRLNRTDKIMATKLKQVARAIVTGHIHMTDDQIANTVIYNR